jgi:spore coat polysaccharide biosynthesis protein SpsF
MKTVIVLQARTGSSRLAGKVLLPLAGKTLLERMVERVSASRLADEIVVATTIDADDDLIESVCINSGIKVFRGHPSDLIDRHYKVALEYNADVVIKIPSDCPLIDPAVIDKVLQFYFDNAARYDFVSNLHPATYPDGNDVEVMPIGVLKTAWLEASKDYEREHTTPFI